MTEPSPQQSRWLPRHGCIALGIFLIVTGLDRTLGLGWPKEYVIGLAASWAGVLILLGK